MRYLKMLVFALLPVVMLALAGCGGGSGSTTQDPFGSKSPVNPPNDPVFPNLSTATGKITLSLTTDVPSIDVDNGQVLAIAKVKAGEAPVAGMTVSFSVLAPTDLVVVGSATAVTDSTGTAVTRITTGHTASTTNVLIQAAIKVGTQSLLTNANFQIVRGGGVIMFTEKANSPPGSQSNLLAQVTKSVPPGDWSYMQLIPFKVTDSNGNPRVGVPVTISAYSITSNDPNDILVDFLVDPSSEVDRQTVTTDSAGQGIFNSEIHVGSIEAKQTVTLNVVFKAVTNDKIPVMAYVGGSYSFTGTASSPVEISPNTAFFTDADVVGAKLQFTISGGSKPYIVTPLNPELASAELQPDGYTVVVALRDTSLWPLWTSFSVIDKDGNAAVVTPLIWRNIAASQAKK